MDTIVITKGSRIRAQWMKAKMNPPSCLAGMQMKFGATSYDVTGVVRHVRGNHPTNPTVVRFFIDPDGDWDGPTDRPDGCTCDREHVEVNPAHVTGAQP